MVKYDTRSEPSSILLFSHIKEAQSGEKRKARVEGALLIHSFVLHCSCVGSGLAYPVQSGRSVQ